ncbi:ferritin family protein [Methanobacterium sp. ACI-7]|uniref:ferritin family protein n=1 Tax=unclassified Methanobacterium TaxID=2627676 RepID=UPI0039C45263
MLSKIPIDMKKVKREDITKEVLRVAIIAELDAINLYEELASSVEDENIKKVFEDVAKEEKTHAGEFMAMLLKEDKEQVRELEEGRKEVEELLGER